MYARRQRMKTHIVLVAGLAALLGLAACGGSTGTGASTSNATADTNTTSGTAPPSTSASSGPSGSADTSDIVIGFAIAETGGFAGFDGAVVNGAKIAVNDINAAGGVLGRKLKIITADAQSKIDGSAPAARTLTGQGALFMGATADYDFGGPALRVANDAGLVGVGMAGDTRLGFHGIGPLVFNVYPGSAAEGVAMAQLAHSKGLTKPYILTDTINSYPKTVADAFEARWKGLTGTDVVGKDLFLNSDTSIRTQIDKIKASGADSILLASFPPGGTAAIRQIRSAGINVPILGDIAFDGDAWVTAVPGLSDVFVPELAFPGSDDAKIQAFFKAYETTTGAKSIAPSYSAIGYAQIQVLAQGIKDAGTTDGAKVASAISQFKDLQTLIGPINYSWRAECNVPASLPWQILHVQNGKLTFLQTMKAEKIPEFKC